MKNALENKCHRIKNAKQLERLCRDPERKISQDRRKWKRSERSDRDFDGNNALSCSYCHKNNHSENKCFKKIKDKKRGSYQKKDDKANMVNDHNTPGEVEANTACLYSSTEVHAVVSIKDPITWIVDSGATKHMCYVKEMFHELDEAGDFGFVKVADGKALPVLGVGSITLECLNSNQNINLKEVLYVPSLKRNLFPVPYASKKGVSVMFNGKNAIMKKDGTVIAHATDKNSLYHLEAQTIIPSIQGESNNS